MNWMFSLILQSNIDQQIFVQSYDAEKYQKQFQFLLDWSCIMFGNKN